MARRRAKKPIPADLLPRDVTIRRIVYFYPEKSPFMSDDEAVLIGTPKIAPVGSHAQVLYGFDYGGGNYKMLATARLGGSWYAWLIPGDFEEGGAFIETMRGSRSKRRRNPRGGRFDRCVADVSRSHSALNPYAVCASRLKPRRRRNMARRTVLTPALARSAGMDAGNRSMRAGGRSKWNWKDVQAAQRELQRLKNPRRHRNVTRRGPRGQLFSLIARKSNQAPMFYTGDKFARHGKPVLFQSLKTAKAVAAFMHRQYPSLRGYTIWAREV